MKDNENRRPMPQAEADGIIEGRNAVIEPCGPERPSTKFTWPRARRTRPWAHCLPGPGRRGRCGGGRPAEAGRHEPHPRPPGSHRPGRRPGIRQHPEHSGQRRRQGGAAPAGGVRRDLRPPQPGGHPPHRRVRRGPRLIIPKRRSAGLTAIVGKTSAGAVSYLPVARVANLTSALKDLKKQGVWIFGTAAGASTDLYSADLKGPAAIVIGSEGDGMSAWWRKTAIFWSASP